VAIPVVNCLLAEENGIPVSGNALGERIRVSGKRSLWSERSGAVIDTVVVHYTSAVLVAPEDPFSRERILSIFCDFGVSSHYMIEREGTVLNLVPEDKKAWHAGGSIMPQGDDRTGVNDFSMGIELVATWDSGFTGEQYIALTRLCLDMEKRFNRRFIYVGHEDIAGERAVALGLRHDIKVDPGVLFDWARFRELLAWGRGIMV
jgi:N-acetyl-anhydromuramyl-L-alanine amidase AmpD